MYDPDLTGFGHQPYFFDQLTDIYSHYVVIGSKIKISGAVDTGSNQNVNLNLSAYYNDTYGDTAIGVNS